MGGDGAAPGIEARRVPSADRPWRVTLASRRPAAKLSGACGARPTE